MSLWNIRPLSPGQRSASEKEFGGENWLHLPVISVPLLVGQPFHRKLEKGKAPFLQHVA